MTVRLSKREASFYINSAIRSMERYDDNGREPYNEKLGLRLVPCQRERRKERLEKEYSYERFDRDSSPTQRDAIKDTKNYDSAYSIEQKSRTPKIYDQYSKPHRQNSCIDKCYDRYSKELLNPSPNSFSKQLPEQILDIKNKTEFSKSLNSKISSKNPQAAPKLNLKLTKNNFLKEYEAKLREIKSKYDNKLELLRQKYSGMTLKPMNTLM
ncbi:unnamed protein product [Moneuplotes crassus]|uniref:Uncharacterized protein n=1 Tax=Euplotes crassus TaxID=5936 RepID=A0AAD1XSP1_EUPCR|nr:unnamed protein product [Moneuplotes crassus]